MMSLTYNTFRKKNCEEDFEEGLDIEEVYNIEDIQKIFKGSLHGYDCVGVVLVLLQFYITTIIIFQIVIFKSIQNPACICIFEPCSRRFYSQINFSEKIGHFV